MNEWGWDEWLTVIAALIGFGYIIVRKIQYTIEDVTDVQAHASGPLRLDSMNTISTRASRHTQVRVQQPILDYDDDEQEAVSPPVLIFQALVEALQGVWRLFAGLGRDKQVSRQEHVQGRLGQTITRPPFVIEAEPEPVFVDRRNEDAVGHSLETPRIEMGKVKEIDTRGNTVRALAMLPECVPALPIARDPMRVPLFFDGLRWVSFNVAEDGFIGVFGMPKGGKGNFLRFFTLSMAKAGPDRARIAVFDSKGGADYWFINDIPHAELYVTSAEAILADAEGLTGKKFDTVKPVDPIVEGLKHYVRVMCARNEMLRNARAEKIQVYNAKVASGEISGEPWPYLVLVLDEIADLSKPGRALLDTLVRMGRAAGLVILCATQHPTVDAISSQVSRNLHNRLVFRISTSAGTHIALGRTSEDFGLYEPSVIDRPGVAVWRREGGAETIGLVPELTAPLQHTMLQEIAETWGVASSVEDESQTQQPDEGDLWRKAQIRYGRLLTDQYVQNGLRLLEDNPMIGVKAMARALYNGSDSGDYFYAAQAIRSRCQHLAADKQTAATS